MNTLTQQISKLHELSNEADYWTKRYNAMKRQNEVNSTYGFVTTPRELRREALAFRKMCLYIDLIRFLYEDIGKTMKMGEVSLSALVNGYDKILMN